MKEKNNVCCRSNSLLRFFTCICCLMWVVLCVSFSLWFCRSLFSFSSRRTLSGLIWNIWSMTQNTKASIKCKCLEISVQTKRHFEAMIYNPFLIKTLQINTHQVYFLDQHLPEIHRHYNSTIWIFAPCIPLQPDKYEIIMNQNNFLINVS